ncbi:polysaccharide deacetylase family protein [Senegalia sp. (in: firmicutes)]|uniref:polysaccharide deacetylase family protein n=1 Tax=Senegalia sp. (in: firmicutes) TaxID=1924098 RepID=UPI003F9501F5
MGKRQINKRYRFIRFIVLCIIVNIAIIVLIGNNKSVSDKNNPIEIKEEEEYIKTNKANLFENKKEEEIKKDSILSLPVEEAYLNDERKIAFLTFDDGPSNNTIKILKILDEKNVKATFFVLGELAEVNEQTIKDIHKKGHSIGNHTYSHEYKKIYASTDNLLNDISKTNNILKNIIGEDYNNRLFRFPGGSFGEKKAVFRKSVVNNGYNYIDWNALNRDSEGNYKNSNELLFHIKDTVKGKKRVVILMHDSPAKKTTVEALPQTIDYLKSEGYEFGILK